MLIYYLVICIVCTFSRLLGYSGLCRFSKCREKLANNSQNSDYVGFQKGIYDLFDWLNLAGNLVFGPCTLLMLLVLEAILL